MILTLPRPQILLANTPDQVIESLVNLMPDYSAGLRLHALYVNKTESALPGNFSQMFGTGKAFRSIFFPSWQADPLLAVADETGLDGAWWSSFSVAVLCQAIAELGSSIRGQMLSADIDRDVASYNATLRSRSAHAYSTVLSRTYQPLVTLLQRVNRSTAKEQFRESLLNNVLTRQLWYQAGQWTSPDWEMFNQYAKYLALGASEAEVDALIDALTAAGLPIPAPVNKQGWRSYAEELRERPAVNVNDIRDACSVPVTEVTYSQYSRNPSGMPNGNSYEFTAKGQPGNQYRRAPGGSCFTGETRVLDADGRAVPLREVKRGDILLTRDGAAAVAYVARPLLSERALYRLTGGGPVFTDTHPFVNAAPVDPRGTTPALLSLAPDVLAWEVPTLSEDGIGALEVGSSVLTRWAGGEGGGAGAGAGAGADADAGARARARARARAGARTGTGTGAGAGAGAGAVSVPSAPAVVTVAGVEQVPATEADTYLFDVRLATGSGASQEFWVGDGETFYLVAPEYPVLDTAGAATATVVAILEGLLGSGGPDGAGWPTSIIDQIYRFGPAIFHSALIHALATTPAFDAPKPPAPLAERIDRLYQAFGSAPAETASVAATLFDGLLASVGQWMTSIVAMGWRSPAVPDGEIASVSVFDIVSTPDSPLGADDLIRMDVSLTGGPAAAKTTLWDRRGRDNTRFHRYFDQIVHMDLAGSRAHSGLTFAITLDGARIPTLFAEAPAALGAAGHALESAQLRDPSGALVGTIRFDTRRVSRSAAAAELVAGSDWNEDAAHAYANALGVAMVEPIAMGLQPAETTG